MYLNNRFYILYLTPFLLGMLSTLSFMPFNLIIVNFVILPFIFYLIVHINKKSKNLYRKKPYKKNLFIFGLVFGFGFYLSGISWITNSLTFDDNFKILIPFALLLIPLVLSLFIALPILFVGPYLKFNVLSLIIFSGSLAFSDYLRGKILSGFPWNMWAYSTSWSNEIMQLLNVVGLHTYNLFIITLFTLPLIIFFKISTIKKLVYFIFAFLILLSAFIYGNYSINKNKKKLEAVEKKIFVKIISPNFTLKYGLSTKEIEERLKKLIRYSDPKKTKNFIHLAGRCF